MTAACCVVLLKAQIIDGADLTPATNATLFRVRTTSYQILVQNFSGLAAFFELYTDLRLVCFALAFACDMSPVCLPSLQLERCRHAVVRDFTVTFEIFNGNTVEVRLQILSTLPRNLV